MKTQTITTLALLLLAIATVGVSLANRRLQHQVKAATDVAERAVEQAKEWKKAQENWKSVSDEWQAVAGEYQTNLWRCLEARRP